MSHDYAGDWYDYSNDNDQLNYCAPANDVMSHHMILHDVINNIRHIFRGTIVTCHWMSLDFLKASLIRLSLMSLPNPPELQQMVQNWEETIWWLSLIRLEHIVQDL